MKRCPQCNHLEADDTLAFCRADGSPLAEAAGEVETSLLPNAVTNSSSVRSTGPTTVLPSLDAQSSTRQLDTASGRKHVASTRNSVIAGAVGVLVVTALGVGSYLKYGRSDNQISSIAVMPFVNASGNQDAEYLSDGMTETLINSLSQLPKLSVKARSSVFRYKGKEVDPQTVGKELDVQAILNGRVVQRGDDLTLYLSLVDTRSGNQLWGEQYNRKQADLLPLQNEIGRDVLVKLRTKLSGADERKLAKSYTENTDAYQLYLQGLFYWNKRSPEGLRRAIEYFKQATTLDPNYALAYSGLANAYSLLPIFDGKIEPRETVPQAREAALKALVLDDNLAEAHASLGLILIIYDWNWVEGIRHYRRAIELKPNFASAHRWLGDSLVNNGRFDEGLAEIRHSVELDPFSVVHNMFLGRALNYARRYDEAITQLQRTLELDPKFERANYNLYEAYANKGMYSEAVATYVRGIESDGDLAHAAGTKEAFGKNGWRGFLQYEAAYLQEQPEALPQDVAHFYARLGDKDKAFAWLEKAYEERSESLTWLKVDPAYDPLRADPRFNDLLRRVGLSQ